MDLAVANAGREADLSRGDLIAMPIPDRHAGPVERLESAFLRMAALHPRSIAIVSEGKSTTYADVAAASARIATQLASLGLGPGARVAILAERGAQYVCSILGVLRSGATMVPLDSSYPGERLKTLAKIARIDALLIPRPGMELGWAEGIDQIVADSAPADANDAPTMTMIDAADPGHPAYMLFTSGSTGVPKCVATGHRPVLHFLTWQRETFGFTDRDRFTHVCGIAHDMMIRDVFAPLSIGATLCIPDQATIFKPGALLRWFEQQRPSVSHLTPAMGTLLLAAAGKEDRLDLRLAFFGGDRLTTDIVAGMKRVSPGLEVVNFYGTTETPQAAAWHRCGEAGDSGIFPIGRGIDGFDLRIVDDRHDAVLSGQAGEIVVVTPYLSLGHVRDGVIAPHGAPDTYHTGDTGIELPSGDIMFLGRSDDRINIRGYRIELAEVAALIAQHPQVSEAYVLIDDRRTDHMVAFVVGRAVEADALRDWLAQRAPGYMVPSEIMAVDRLPLLPNGKLDRQALLALPRTQGSGHARAPHRAATEMEARLIEAWRPHLPTISSPEHSFQQLRGDSLAYVQIFLETEAIVGDLPDDWQAMTIAEIARMKPQERKWYKFIDGAMAIRAIAITLVVAFHLGILSIRGGATSGLLMVSGFLLGRLQIKEVMRTGSSAPLWRLLGRVALPTLIYTTGFWLIKTAAGKPISNSVLFLYADFVAYGDHQLNEARGYAFFLWYICCFLHMIAAFAGVLWLIGKVRPAWLFADRLLAITFCIAIPLKFALPPLVNAAIGTFGLAPLTIWSFVPTNHFATLVLGACLAQAVTRRQKLVWTVIAMAYVAATYLTVSNNSFLVMALAASTLLFVKRIPIASFLHGTVLRVSGASLFIYLTHMQFAHMFTRAGVPNRSVLLVPLTCAGGIALWQLWKRLISLGRKLSRFITERHLIAPA